MCFKKSNNIATQLYAFFIFLFVNHCVKCI